MQTAQMSPVTMFPLNGGTYNADGTTVASALSTATPPLPPPPRLHHSYLLRGPSGLPRMLQQVPPTTIPRRWALLGPKIALHHQPEHHHHWDFA